MQEERLRVAQTDPEALKRWLVLTGRKYLVLNSADLVDALRWPDGHQVLQQLIEAYRNHRRTIESGKVERQETMGVVADVKLMKSEVLELEEKRELWEQLGKELELAS